MAFWNVTLATVESDRPASAQVIAPGESAAEAEEWALQCDHEQCEWSDAIGNDMDWNDVDGTIVVADGTEPYVAPEVVRPGSVEPTCDEVEAFGKANVEDLKTRFLEIASTLLPVTGDSIESGTSVDSDGFTLNTWGGLTYTPTFIKVVTIAGVRYSLGWELGAMTILRSGHYLEPDDTDYAVIGESTQAEAIAFMGVKTLWTLSADV